MNATPPMNETPLTTNPAPPMNADEATEEWLMVAELAELGRANRRKVIVAGTPVALFLIGGRVFALRDTCVHKQRSLSKGTVLHGKVVCPGHQWKFDPETGQAEDRDECQPVYAVRVDGGHVYLNTQQRVPDAAGRA
jgi:nitrite reductase/ring-hydroxylating ferredoxin subunit